MHIQGSKSSRPASHLDQRGVVSRKEDMLDMFTEPEIEKLEGQLDEFRVSSRQKYEAEQTILAKYEHLLEAYRRLKSDFEEERESRERYKKMARGQDRNPFVLLLLDLDGYIFNDNLLKAGKDGGSEAAQLLRAEVKEAIQVLADDADRCKIMFRGYTNLQGLSISMARAGLAGLEARSLAPFASSFTRAEDLFDIVDAGDKKEGTDFKIRESFRLFVDSSQCRHIYFGACHDSSYLSLLTPWKGRSDKITLIRSTTFQPDFLKLGLNVVEFPTVFRARPATSTLSSPPPHHAKAAFGKVSASPKPGSSQKSSERKPCIYFQQGKCRNGDSCKFGHVLVESRNGTDHSNNHTHKNIHADWRSGNSTEATNSPVKQESHQKARHVAGSLPCDSPTNQGLIPINCDEERLDTYMAPPTTEQWDRFNRRIEERKLCNRYHLTGKCNEPACQYDHDPIDLDIFQTLKYVARSNPCGKMGNCRSATCVNGHICQRDGCWGGSGCKFKHKMHYIDPVPAKWVKPTQEAFADPSMIDLADTDPYDTPSPNGNTINGASAVGRFQSFPW